MDLMFDMKDGAVARQAELIERFATLALRTGIVKLTSSVALSMDGVWIAAFYEPRGWGTQIGCRMFVDLGSIRDGLLDLVVELVLKSLGEAHEAMYTA
jgi:hypothetical protein